jgi:nucleotide-binding universal stress UspA family protein
MSIDTDERLSHSSCRPETPRLLAVDVNGRIARAQERYWKQRDEALVEATEDEMTETTKPYLILAGIDYSPTSELALEGALELAMARAHAELHVVHVTPVFEIPETGDGVANLGMDALIDQQALRTLRTYVSVSVAAFEKKRNASAGLQLRVVCHLRAHAPAHEIAQLAADLKVDLVVVGMHGRGAFTRFFLGSVAESVTRLAPCPVLVFRPKGIPQEYPRIEPPCPICIEARQASAGAEYWCEQHRERHGQRHVYYQVDRPSGHTNLPLVCSSSASDA